MAKTRHSLANSGSFLGQGNRHQHHERWNGSGYPKHISGRDILPKARIFGVIDSYDAMVFRRAYNNVPKHHEEAIDGTRKSAGPYCPSIKRSSGRSTLYRITISFLRTCANRTNISLILIWNTEAGMKTGKGIGPRESCLHNLRSEPSCCCRSRFGDAAGISILSNLPSQA